jgi:hypothetical protein
MAGGGFYALVWVVSYLAAWRPLTPFRQQTVSSGASDLACALFRLFFHNRGARLHEYTNVRRVLYKAMSARRVSHKYFSWKELQASSFTIALGFMLEECLRRVMWDALTAPPSLGWIITIFSRVCTPVPHVVEHAEYPPQSVVCIASDFKVLWYQLPSCYTEISIIFIKYQSKLVLQKNCFFLVQTC